MKKTLLTLAITSTVFAATAAELSTDDQKISYVIGSQIAQTLKNSVDGPIQLDKDAVFAAMNDKLAGKKSQISATEAQELMKTFSTKAMAYAKAKAEKAAKDNQAEAKKLLAENRKKEGVKVTASGLQYRVIKQGTGAKPRASDIVKVNYMGKLANGKVFDSSYQRGQPAEFPLNQVIAGWTEGLQLMPVGSTYEFIIPANLAYGARGPGEIGPDRALTFEVELLAIEKAKEPDTAVATANAKATGDKAAAQVKTTKDGN